MEESTLAFERCAVWPFQPFIDLMVDSYLCSSKVRGNQTGNQSTGDVATIGIAAAAPNIIVFFSFVVFGFRKRLLHPQPETQNALKWFTSKTLLTLLMFRRDCGIFAEQNGFSELLNCEQRTDMKFAWIW
jgi:hypothetical protein